MQDLWKKNRSRCANKVLSGQWKEESSILLPAEMFSFWEDILSKPLEIDRRSPDPVRDPLWQLMSPVTDEELANTIRKSKSSAPGPDDWFADFPYLHCSISQGLFTSETCCGYGYDLEQKLHRFPRIFTVRLRRTSRDKRRGALYGTVLYLQAN